MNKSIHSFRLSLGCRILGVKEQISPCSQDQNLTARYFQVILTVFGDPIHSHNFKYLNTLDSLIYLNQDV